MALLDVLHSLAWVLFQEVGLAMPEQDVAASRRSGTIDDGAIFPHCRNFDDYDRAFGLLAGHGVLERIPFPEAMACFTTEDEFDIYRLRLNAPDLERHFTTCRPDIHIDEAALIGSFLDLARKLGRHVPTKDLPPIPVSPEPREYPPYFAAAVTALCSLGYCLLVERRMLWLPKIRPIMIAEGIWEDGRPKAEVWREQLHELIALMPDQLRSRTFRADGTIDRLFISYAFRHYWDPLEGWCNTPRLHPLSSDEHPFSTEQLLEFAAT